jgi:HEAT repeat protein
VPSQLGRAVWTHQTQQKSWGEILQGTVEYGDGELLAALRSPAPEQRFAAALVVGERRLPWINPLIGLLTDPNPAVRQAARRSLVILSFLKLNPEEAVLIASANPSRPPKSLADLNQPVDFGPKPADGRADQVKAAKKWKQWWKDQKKPRTRVITTAAKGRAAPEAEAKQLATALEGAEVDKRRKLLTDYRDKKGVRFTETLAFAAGHLGCERRRELREALAERMTRMTLATLGRYLQDESAEIRRAAVLALAARESKAHASRMIAMLDDPEPAVGRAAYASLCSLSGKDFGPTLSATREERDAAAGRWKAWARTLADKEPAGGPGK